MTQYNGGENPGVCESGRRSKPSVGRLNSAWRALKLMFIRLVRSNFSAHQIALGAAIGILVAWTPTIGFQMMIAVPICLLFRANPLAAIPPIWVTNPVTAVPIFGFNYQVGRLFLEGPSFKEFSNQMTGVYEAMKNEGLRESLTNLQEIGSDIFWPLMAGSLLVGVALAAVLYPATRLAVNGIRTRRKRRRVALAE